MKLRSLLLHLRLPFQLLLAPVYLWGWLVAGGGFSASIVLGFFALHVFLYSGATAFNSYYDRDEGPIGGLERPPPVEPALLPLALAMKGLGALLAWLVNLWFFCVYALFALLSLAYSHPRVRLKANVWASLLTVGFGQGVLAFVGGWAATRGELESAWSPDGVVGAAAATLLILAVYPLTQVYQVDEDRARGDQTVAVAWGTRAAFTMSVVCQAAGGAAMLVLIAGRFGALDALGVGAGLAIQMLAVAWWSRHYDSSALLKNYRRVMRLNTVSAGVLSAYLLARLWVR